MASYTDEGRLARLGYQPTGRRISKRAPAGSRGARRVAERLLLLVDDRRYIRSNCYSTTLHDAGAVLRVRVMSARRSGSRPSCAWPPTTGC